MLSVLRSGGLKVDEEPQLMERAKKEGNRDSQLTAHLEKAATAGSPSRLWMQAVGSSRSG